MTDLPVLSGVLTELSNLTGKRFDASSFNSRLRIQKSVYLLQALGSSNVRDYYFTNYFRGPYCPALARDYYEISAKVVCPATVKLAQRERSILKSCIDKGDLFLETVCTLHSIYRQRLGQGKDEVFDTARKLKPFLSTEMCENSWIFLRVAGLV